MINLELHNRDTEGQIIVGREEVDPSNLAIVVMDVWDYHWCRQIRVRYPKLIPRMNQTFMVARKLGITVCFSPTGAIRDLKDTPQYKAMQLLPQHPMPAPKILDIEIIRKKNSGVVIPPRWGDCECGFGYPCVNVRHANNQHPDLKMVEGDYIVLETQDMWNVIKKHNITHIILTGFATNMCLLGKPCGVVPLKSRGLKVYLARDLTDACTGYIPGFTPYEGTLACIREVEQYICPSLDIEHTLRKSGVWDDNPILDYVLIFPWGRNYEDRGHPTSMHVELRLPKTRKTEGAEIRYTIDGKDPTPRSRLYTFPICFEGSHTIKATAFRNNERVAFISKAQFCKMLPLPKLPTIYLSDLKPITEVNGENCRKARKDLSVCGYPLTNYLNKYIKGVGVQAPSELIYEIKSDYQRFVTLAGVDDGKCGSNAPGDSQRRAYARIAYLVFKIYIDDQIISQSPTMTHGEKAWIFDIKIPEKAKHLKLIVADEKNRLGDPNGCGDWLNAGFITNHT
jgi:hypothetical protein